MVYRTYWGFYGCWSTFHCCSTNTSSLLWELWSRASDEQGRSLIIRSDGWGPELSQGGAGEGWGRMNIRQEGWWEIEGKWERKSGWGRFTGHVMEGEKDEQRKTSEPPQRRTRLTNYLLLHYRGCQRGRLCQPPAAHTPSVWCAHLSTQPAADKHSHHVPHFSIFQELTSGWKHLQAPNWSYCWSLMACCHKQLEGWLTGALQSLKRNAIIGSKFYF